MSADPLVEGHSLDTQLDDLARSAAKQRHQMEDILDNPASVALSWDWACIPELPSLSDVFRAATFAFSDRLTALQWLVKPNSHLDLDSISTLHPDRTEVLKVLYREVYGFSGPKFPANWVI